jgi:hypothetical protein
MINQITSISQRETQSVPEINRGLIQARRIQARLKGRMTDTTPIGDGLSRASLISALSHAG